ncbi:hypothetical protein HK413_10245 [Mucilaginibacter sp. S1162]|uniref:Uncharacterized protein n=1 Tax=Mucilaginibacter humi TaxID=2732510 RepID=A0ABX1W543_9SPHI|nr:hypothetical protein [Mucilaginibacter humi]NNU34414.1 hypothetical protein [Mucilaginibacter humi]
MKALEDRFRLNELLRKPLKERLKTEIDKALVSPIARSAFQKQLTGEDIQVIFRQNEEGRLYGITFVDHYSKAVFNGSDLGKAYSAAALAGWFKSETTTPGQQLGNERSRVIPAYKSADNLSGAGHSNGNEESLVDMLFKEEQQDMSALGRLQQRKRKKKEKDTHFKFYHHANR